MQAVLKSPGSLLGTLPAGLPEAMISSVCRTSQRQRRLGSCCLAPAERSKWNMAWRGRHVDAPGGRSFLMTRMTGGRAAGNAAGAPAPGAVRQAGCWSISTISYLACWMVWTILCSSASVVPAQKMRMMVICNKRQVIYVDVIRVVVAGGNGGDCRCRCAMAMTDCHQSGDEASVAMAAD